MIHLKKEEELLFMRGAGKVVTDVLDVLRGVVRAGVSTAELERVAQKRIELSGGEAAFKGYRPSNAERPFPGVICTSVNGEIVHGIPSDERILEEGDIVSVDVGVLLKGYYGDAACTYPVGNISVGRRKLLEVTEKSLDLAIAVSKAGNTVGDIGYAIESHVMANVFGVVRDYTGHGVGKILHEAPQVPNFGKRGRGVTL